MLIKIFIVAMVLASASVFAQTLGTTGMFSQTILPTCSLQNLDATGMLSARDSDNDGFQDTFVTLRSGRLEFLISCNGNGVGVDVTFSRPLQVSGPLLNRYNGPNLYSTLESSGEISATTNPQSLSKTKTFQANNDQRKLYFGMTAINGRKLTAGAYRFSINASITAKQ